MMIFDLCVSLLKQYDIIKFNSSLKVLVTVILANMAVNAQTMARIIIAIVQVDMAEITVKYVMFYLKLFFYF